MKNLIFAIPLAFIIGCGDKDADTAEEEETAEEVVEDTAEEAEEEEGEE